MGDLQVLHSRGCSRTNPAGALDARLQRQKTDDRTIGKPTLRTVARPFGTCTLGLVQAESEPGSLLTEEEMANKALAPPGLAIALLIASGPGSGATTQKLDNTGHLYGTVTTSKGNSYVGLLRWGREEAFWDDLFNSNKNELPYFEQYGDDSDRGRSIRIFGREFKVSWGEQGGRQFAVRFGDIDRIDARGSGEAEVTIRSGETLAVEGGSNDLSGNLTVHDASLGKVEVPWRYIETVQFAPAPAEAVPDGHRLHGKVESTDGVFEGFIQWDAEECMSTDELDGESDDLDLSIEMGNIGSIERESKKRAKVTLRDGRELVLEGTNDVDSSIRGILVEDERFGRVRLSWEAFVRVDFSEPGPSGNGYADYRDQRALRGTVVDRQGARHRGRLVYDLDEAFTWEMLDGSTGEIEYSIPFALVTAIAPRGDGTTEVELRDGTSLRLADAQDVGDDNDGVLVLGSVGTDPHFIPWAEVDRIELEPGGEPDE